MPVKAKLNYLRISPRKVRLVADLIRGKSVEEAQNILNFVPKKATLALLKLLKSAIANAKNNLQISDSSNLYISKITVGEGPKLKRWRARARGVAAQIQKKSSHVTLILDEIKKTTEGREIIKEKEIKESRKIKETKVEKSEKKKIPYW